MQICVSRKSSKSRKYSKIYWPAELCQPHVICIPKIFEDFFACIIVLAASHQYPGKFQRLFRLQNHLSLKSSISRKYSETYWSAELSQPQVICIPKISEDFFGCRIVLTANHQYPGNIQRLFCLPNCLSCKSSVCRNIRRLLRLQKCLNRKSSISRKYSKTFSPAELSLLEVIDFPKNSKTFLPTELSQPQIINIPKILKVFFACRIVLDANHQYPGKIQ